MSVRSAGTSTGPGPARAPLPGSGGSAVASSRSRVVLPAPFGPSSPITPGSRSRSTSARAWVAPNVRPTPRRLIERRPHGRYLRGRSWLRWRPRTRKTANDAAASTRKAAWIRACSTTVGESDRVHEQPDRHEPGGADGRGRVQRADPGGRGQHHRDEADRRQQPDERRPHPARPARAAATAGSARARTAIVRSSTRRSAGYGVTISGSRAGSHRRS